MAVEHMVEEHTASHMAATHHEVMHHEAIAMHHAAAPHHDPVMRMMHSMTGADGLADDDIVGVTFYIACNMMLAFTLFFLVQVGQVPKQWKTSLTVASIVTGIAFYNYTYMKDTWVKTHNSPTQFRYTDWLITVPLQIVEFVMILKAQKPVPAGMASTYFGMSLLMVFAGWAAENNFIGKLPGFVLGCACWLWIVYDVSAGEGAKQAATLKSEASKSAFSTLRMIVGIGWTIYPIGYAVAYIIPGPIIRPHREGPPYDALNIVYNLADLVNKGGFGMCVWSAAMEDQEMSMPKQTDKKPLLENIC